MESKIPSWDDLVAATPLNLKKLFEGIDAARAQLPADATIDQWKQVAEEKLGEAFTETNLIEAGKTALTQLRELAMTGSGPVEKGPTDLA